MPIANNSRAVTSHELDGGDGLGVAERPPQAQKPNGKPRKQKRGTRRAGT